MLLLFGQGLPPFGKVVFLFFQRRVASLQPLFHLLVFFPQRLLSARQTRSQIRYRRPMLFDPVQLRTEVLGQLLAQAMEAIRRLGLRGTTMACAQVNTLRIKLLKIGAVITRNTRRIRIHLASGCPNQTLFLLVARRLALE